MSCNKLHSRRRLYYLSRMVARLKILFLLGLALLLAAPAPASIPRDVFQPLRETSASGNLTRYIHNGDTCHLVRDWADPLKRPLMEVKLDGSPTCAWIWANDLLIAQVDDIGTIHYAHTDELGNLIALSDSAGHITDQFAYDPYGKLISRTGTTDIPFTWLADYGVVSLGNDLYATLHRTYHAGYARFLSKDPAGLNGGLNLYAYGDLNPLFYVDYLGLCAQNFDSRGNIKQPAASQEYGFVSDLRRQQFQAEEDYKRQTDPYYDLQPGYADPVSVLDDPITFVAFGLARVAAPAMNTLKVTTSAKTVSTGTTVTRNWGGESGPAGQSWTRDLVSTQSRNSLGLETKNTAEFISTGTIVDNSGITTRAALPWGRFSGGGDEVLIPNANAQIQLNAVTMPDKPLPFYR